jgi:hypothetical protein
MELTKTVTVAHSHEPFHNVSGHAIAERKIVVFKKQAHNR